MVFTQNNVHVYVHECESFVKSRFFCQRQKIKNETKTNNSCKAKAKTESALDITL